MKNFIDNSLAYGVLTSNNSIIKEALEAGADPQKVKVDDDSYYSRGQNKNALLYSWNNRRGGQDSVFQQLYKSLNRKFDSEQVILVMELLKTKEGLPFLEDQLNKGLDLANMIDEKGNTLLHQYWLELSSGYYTNALPLENLEFLLKLKINPNSVNNQGKTPMHLVRSFKNDKLSGSRVKMMMDFGADLTLTDAEGVSVLTHLVEANLQSAEVLPLVKKTSLKSVGRREIQAVMKRNRVSEKLVQTYIERGALEEYKMMEYISPTFPKVKYSDMEALLSFNEEFDSLLKMDKLKDFMNEVFGVSGSNLTNKFIDNCKNSQNIDYGYIHAGMVLKKIFIESENRNVNYLTDLLEKKKVVVGLNHLARSCSIDQTANFFKIFSQQQAKTLLESMEMMKIKDVSSYSYGYWSSGEDCILLEDTVKMFWKHPTDLEPMIKELKFNNINTMNKLHDYIAKEAMKLKNKPFNLNQEMKTPELEKIHQKDLIGLEGYSIYVAQCNYDLINWGSSLHNCVGGGSYAEKALTGQSILLGVMYQNEIKYCVEISDKQIVQNEGKARSKMPDPVLNALNKTLRRHKILKGSAIEVDNE